MILGVFGAKLTALDREGVIKVKYVDVLAEGIVVLRVELVEQCFQVDVAYAILQIRQNFDDNRIRVYALAIRLE